MITGINIADTKDHISKYDPDKEKATIWKIGILDSILVSKIQNVVTTYEAEPGNPRNIRAKATVNIKEQALEIVRFGLKGFENFLHPQTNEPIKFDFVSISRFGKNYNVVSDEILKIIPSKVLEELAEEISKESGLTEPERKN
jgi:hypothetical protein